MHKLAKDKARNAAGALDQVAMVRALLAQQAVFGSDLSKSQQLEEATVAGLLDLDIKGVDATLKMYAARSRSASERLTA